VNVQIPGSLAAKGNVNILGVRVVVAEGPVDENGVQADVGETTVSPSSGEIAVTTAM
jgi:hypothetical protein